MIKIGKIWLEENDNKTRAYCNITLKDEIKKIWFEVDKKYSQYLCIERADAYVIGLLNYALKNNEDIECELPVTEELLYNINTILIPSLVKYAKTFNRIKVKAETAEALKCGFAVGTGCSCGVDSFASIVRHTNSNYPGLDITHLCLNNVGAFNECYTDYGPDKVKDERYEVTKNVAKDLNLELIETDSNFAIEIEQNHFKTHTYSSTFAIYMLQKLWKVYYYASSGHDFNYFSLEDNDDNSAALYELLSLQCFSIEGLKIYSDCGEMIRIEKIKSIVDFPVAQKYLHVCLRQPTNCTKGCSKCKRTLLSLDALGKLEEFKAVFDIEYYKENRKDYYEWLYEQHFNKDDLNEPTYQLLKDKKEFVSIKLKFAFKMPFVMCKNFIKKVLKKVLPESVIKRLKKEE